MTTQNRAVAPGTTRTRRSGPSLRPVPTPSPTAPRAPFVALVVVILGLGLVGLVLLSTSLQHGAFAIQDLERSNATLRDRQQALAQAVDLQESPERLAERARSLGMVPSERRAFIRLPDGKVIGDAAPAPSPPRPEVPKTATPQAAEDVEP